MVEMLTDYLKSYKTILLLPNAHLQGYVQTSFGANFRDVISMLFPRIKRPRGVVVSLRHHWERY